MFCKAGKQAAANELYVPIDHDSGGDKTFSVPLHGLNAQPTDPPTHYGANTAVDAQMDTDIKNAGPTITRYFEADGYTWGSALQDMWLKVIEADP
jgi:hypothetical protein